MERVDCRPKPIIARATRNGVACLDPGGWMMSDEEKNHVLPEGGREPLPLAAVGAAAGYVIFEGLLAAPVAGHTVGRVVNPAALSRRRRPPPRREGRQELQPSIDREMSSDREATIHLIDRGRIHIYDDVSNVDDYIIYPMWMSPPLFACYLPLSSLHPLAWMRTPLPESCGPLFFFEDDEGPPPSAASGVEGPAPPPAATAIPCFSLSSASPASSTCVLGVWRREEARGRSC